MKIEELQAIVNLLMSLGESSKEAFIWWVALDKGLGFLESIIIVGTLAYAALRIARLAMADGVEMQVRVLRDAMGVGTSGPVTDGELAAMRKWVEARK